MERILRFERCKYHTWYLRSCKTSTSRSINNKESCVNKSQNINMLYIYITSLEYFYDKIYA